MRKLNITVIVGIVVALIGAGIVFAYGHNVDHKISSGKQTVSVLVADEFLGSGMTAGDVVSHVHVAQIPSAYVVKNAISDTTNLSGNQASSAVLSGAVPEGGQLSYNDFTSAGQAGRLAPSKGDVALSVETPLSSGVARYLQPGQMVDAFVTYSGGSGASGSSTTASRTKLFASGVKVLSVTVAQPSDNSNSGDSSDNAATPTGSVIVLLDLSPVNAEKVVNAVTLGQIYLAYTTNAHDKTPSGATPDSVVRSNR